jgi:hypothetical protein
MQSNAPDRVNQIVWLMLAILGAFLAIAGWYRFFAGS